MKLTAGVLYVLVLLCASNGALAENVREDGNWWRSFGRESHRLGETFVLRNNCVGPWQREAGQ